ncbi:NAD-dependent epimerase/dehydratase family protein [Pedobacter steynii]
MDYTIKPTHNIVITGGGGYLGAKLAEKLASLGCDVYLVDINFNILAKTLDVNFSNVYLKILDLTDRKSVKEVVRDCNPQHIFHFASVIDRSRDFSIFERLYKVNVTGTFNLLEELLDVPYVNFCFASTSEVYGDWKGLPFKEEDCLNPMSPYSLTKLYSENLIKLHSKINQDKPYKILRIFNFFGIDMPETTFMGQMVKSYKDNNIFAMTKGSKLGIFYISKIY